MKWFFHHFSRLSSSNFIFLLYRAGGCDKPCRSISPPFFGSMVRASLLFYHLIASSSYSGCFLCRGSWSSSLLIYYKSLFCKVLLWKKTAIISEFLVWHNISIKPQSFHFSCWNLGKVRGNASNLLLTDMKAWKTTQAIQTLLWVWFYRASTR